MAACSCSERVRGADGGARSRGAARSKSRVALRNERTHHTLAPVALSVDGAKDDEERRSGPSRARASRTVQAVPVGYAPLRPFPRASGTGHVPNYVEPFARPLPRRGSGTGMPPGYPEALDRPFPRARVGPWWRARALAAS